MIEKIETQQATVRLQLLDQYFVLHPSKAIYWEELDLLLIADLHFGKATHFRKAGLQVPKQVATTNQKELINLLTHFSPDRVLFLGDLFHSTLNQEWETLGAIFATFPAISFELVIGNHDILTAQDYDHIQLTTYPEPLAIGNFLLTHHPMSSIPTGQFNFCGHIHPCVWLSGSGKQYLKLPCFFFQEQQCTLPAFGAFTGMAKQHPVEGDQVFVIAESQVLPVF
ncbi:MAG: ligase-associated DNA damage response endonuclease PdeM [Bacteroidota bacterium]